MWIVTDQVLVNLDQVAAISHDAGEPIMVTTSADGFTDGLHITFHGSDLSEDQTEAVYRHLQECIVRPTSCAIDLRSAQLEGLFG